MLRPGPRREAWSPASPAATALLPSIRVIPKVSPSMATHGTIDAQQWKDLTGASRAMKASEFEACTAAGVDSIDHGTFLDDEARAILATIENENEP